MEVPGVGRLMNESIDPISVVSCLSVSHRPKLACFIKSKSKISVVKVTGKLRRQDKANAHAL